MTTLQVKESEKINNSLEAEGGVTQLNDLTTTNINGNTQDA